jgi:hypothetical protein
VGAGFIRNTVSSRYFQLVGAASSRDFPYPATTHNRGWKPLPLIINLKAIALGFIPAQNRIQSN